MTRDEVVARASAFALDSKHSQISKTDKEEILKTVYTTVTDQYYAKHPDLFLVDDTLSTVADTRTVDLPANSRWTVLQLKRADGGVLVYSNAPYNDTTPGEPAWYKIIDGKIHLRPVPSVAGELEIKYYRTADTIEQPTSIIDLPPNQEIALIYYLASELWELLGESGKANRYGNKGQTTIDSWNPYRGATQQPRIERTYNEGSTVVTDFGEETYITREVE